MFIGISVVFNINVLYMLCFPINAVHFSPRPGVVLLRIEVEAKPEEDEPRRKNMAAFGPPFPSRHCRRISQVGRKRRKKEERKDKERENETVTKQERKDKPLGISIT